MVDNGKDYIKVDNEKLSFKYGYKANCRHTEPRGLQHQLVLLSMFVLALNVIENYIVFYCNDFKKSWVVDRL